MLLVQTFWVRAMRRSDGDLIKDLDPFVEMIPYIMEKRSDSQNFAKHVFVTDPIDEYIKARRKQGQKIGYLHFFIACYVRLLYERPQLNRFIMNSRTYQRKGVYVSMAIKRSFREDGEETTVKFAFTGKENLFEVAEIIEQTIASSRHEDSNTDTDRLVASLMKFPGFLKRFLVHVLKSMDRHNMLPESVIDVSPFHTSLFFTHLKSINTDYIYHHLYDFGTTGIFVALGKINQMPVVIDQELVVRNCIQVGYTTDERLCDGVYLARALKRLEKFIANPSLLEQTPSENDVHR